MFYCEKVAAFLFYIIFFPQHLVSRKKEHFACGSWHWNGCKVDLVAVVRAKMCSSVMKNVCYFLLYQWIYEGLKILGEKNQRSAHACVLQGAVTLCRMKVNVLHGFIIYTLWTDWLTFYRFIQGFCISCLFWVFFVDFNFLVFFSLSLGLLCGDFVPDRDRHSSSSNSPDPPVVPEGYLLARICSQRPGPDEGQVSKCITCTY